MTGREKPAGAGAGKGERGAAGRARAGALLKRLRTEAGLSQGELAARMSEIHSTFISQLETGRAVLPSGKVAPFAEACDVDTGEFAARLLALYDPEMFQALFGVAPDAAAEPTRRSAPQPLDEGLQNRLLRVLNESDGPRTLDQLLDPMRSGAGAGEGLTRTALYQLLYRLWRQDRVHKLDDRWSGAPSSVGAGSTADCPSAP